MVNGSVPEFGARQWRHVGVYVVIDRDRQLQTREPARQRVGDVLGLFRAGSVVQAQRAGFDMDVPDRVHPGHRGFVVDDTTRPASTSVWSAAALRGQRLARHAT
ncbi:hypothetical protein [Nocardia pneumoniae]|uniref:hypothetical protein n=1 Tax=Nocardia pneumoniae TaxID=228601 RepID=UPI0012F6C0F1|nr:hypothetical protein [Nocardia pneumoniae]